MSLPKKGARQIQFEGTAFRWRLRSRPTHSQGVEQTNFILAVEVADCSKKGSVLLVDLGMPHPSSWLGAKPASIVPADVTALIRKALALGWQPHMPGKQFRMDSIAQKAAG